MKRWRTEGFARRGFVAAALALLVIAGAVSAKAESPPAATSSFSPEKLARVGDYLRNEIATGKTPARWF